MRKLIQQIGTLLLGICSAGIVYVVTQEQIAIFKHALFVKRSFVNADSIVQNFFAGKSTNIPGSIRDPLIFQVN